MPCMGPSWDKTKHIEITEEILAMLEARYHLTNGGLTSKNSQYHFDDGLKDELKEIIRKIVETDALNGF